MKTVQLLKQERQMFLTKNVRKWVQQIMSVDTYFSLYCHNKLWI